MNIPNPTSRAINITDMDIDTKSKGGQMAIKLKAKLTNEVKMATTMNNKILLVLFFSSLMRYPMNNQLILIPSARAKINPTIINRFKIVNNLLSAAISG
jgi:hypothetical protein